MAKIFARFDGGKTVELNNSTFSILDFTEQNGEGTRTLAFAGEGQGCYVHLTKAEVKQLRAWALQQSINDLTEI